MGINKAGAIGAEEIKNATKLSDEKKRTYPNLMRHESEVTPENKISELRLRRLSERV